jgi:hypothetical protein
VTLFDTVHEAFLAGKMLFVKKDENYLLLSYSSLGFPTNQWFSFSAVSDDLTEFYGAVISSRDGWTWNSYDYYTKPSGGIPKTDLASAVQTSLGKADSALQSQEQSDWNESDNTKAAYIKNKPSIPAGVVVDQTYDGTSTNAQSGVAMAGALAGKQDLIDSSHKLSYNLLSDTPTIPDAQIQSDWSQSDNTAKDYIKNKPSIPDVSGKADKVSGVTSGNFAGLDSNGNLTDSGSKASDFATASQGTKADTAYQKPQTGIPGTDLEVLTLKSIPESGTYTESEFETAVCSFNDFNKAKQGAYVSVRIGTENPTKCYPLIIPAQVINTISFVTENGIYTIDAGFAASYNIVTSQSNS